MGFLNEILKTKDIILRGIANASSNAHGVNETVSLSDIYAFIKEVLLFLAGIYRNLISCHSAGLSLFSLEST